MSLKEKLQEDLKQAIKEERYEDAAKIRDEIKKMSKQEFEQFIFKVQNTNQKFCAKCGNFTLDRITISVAKDGKSPRKLCNMCKNCYTDMLDHLGISDIKN